MKRKVNKAVWVSGSGELSCTNTSLLLSGVFGHLRAHRSWRDWCSGRGCISVWPQSELRLVEVVGPWVRLGREETEETDRPNVSMSRACL